MGETTLGNLLFCTEELSWSMPQMCLYLIADLFPDLHENIRNLQCGALLYFCNYCIVALYHTCNHNLAMFNLQFKTHRKA